MPRAIQKAAYVEYERLLQQLIELESDWGKLARTELLAAKEARDVPAVLQAILVAAGHLFIPELPDPRRQADNGTKRKLRAQQWLAKAAKTARPILGVPAPTRAAKAGIDSLRRVIGDRPEAQTFVASIMFGGHALRRDTPNLPAPKPGDEDDVELCALPVIIGEPLAAVHR